jgi:arylsulfatase A-like enzyme
MLTHRAPISPNILLIVLDTTRADALGLGAGGGVAPSMQAAALHGRAYLRATSPSPWTPPAHASILTGLAPGEHGVWGPNLLDAQGWPRPGCMRGAVLDRWLPAVLGARGHRTLGISANAWIGGHLGFDHGFDRFVSVNLNPSGRTKRTRAIRLARLLPEPAANGLRRGRITAHLRRRGQDWGAARSLMLLREWLAESDRPFFALVNFMEPHWPYYPPSDLEGYSPAERRFALEVLVRYRNPASAPVPSPEDAAMLCRLYLGEVRYLDRRLGELLELLNSLNRLDDTVVVIVADHGEHLGEHGLVGHVGSVHEELLHVPLLVLGPKELVGRGVENARVSTQGLYRAMLDWAGCKAAQLVEEAPVLAEYEGVWHHAGSLRRTRAAADNGRLKATVWVIYEQAWKYVRDATGAETLYNLDADPGETADVDADAPRAPLRRQLAQALEHQRPCLLEERSGPAERDPMVEHELKALGYL